MMFPVRHVDVLLRTKNVNNVRISREIDEMVMNIIRVDVAWLRSVQSQVYLVELIEEYINEYFETEMVLKNFEVICDHRNNTKEDCAASKVNVTIKYQQVNCLNITELAYQFTL